MTFVDDYSRVTWVFFLQSRSPSIFMTFHITRRFKLNCLVLSVFFALIMPKPVSSILYVPFFSLSMYFMFPRKKAAEIALVSLFGPTTLSCSWKRLSALH
uniref:Uncharacterized protein n=1 Tax=Utricularia reniformis TaxID=192314 RepID=A0A1Y0AZ77_9LAMI|nr:hypothetical protein AEK19_MT2295 [Utricularia reniformis]ART30443.1 hypothetical protein AEK19_MT2295 [Utricularia reniformis]